jgi:hypothetical protein
LRQILLNLRQQIRRTGLERPDVSLFEIFAGVTSSTDEDLSRFQSRRTKGRLDHRCRPMLPRHRPSPGALAPVNLREGSSQHCR